MKTNSWPKTKNSLYGLCKEFSETYQIDALGMGIESLKKRISAEDCIRLEEVSGAIKTKQYRVTLWTEILPGMMLKRRTRLHRWLRVF